ncbi:hypothetical protein TDMWS_21150 [Thermodesulfomicrobium sp. WS]|uniref:trypsin-like serine protease n=1 Tax=Thermodesulfomicrobium sp. WS TaxID=3004129 RepID=UPI0024939B50|nr:trypsin-like serine protease [Thermodesulfomicrobium sp. WS]BDV02030.1 hypothetical protein TDMWS_21150 [Thermodesulfomicrobium sp. WS]
MPSLAVSFVSSLWDFAVSPGMGFDGVVYVHAQGFAGTGTLLPDGRHVLTAAHVVEENGTILWPLNVEVDGPWGSTTIAVHRVAVHPLFDLFNENHDLAILELTSPAPVTAERYPIYREEDELGRTFTLVGYGEPGTGLQGTAVGGPTKIWGQNRFDADMAALNAKGLLAWTPKPGVQLAADMDSGSVLRDALGKLLGVSHLGLGASEAIITPGDSGGPAFVDGKIAGVASYGASLWTSSAHPDIDDTVNGSFGEVAGWQRVSVHQQWIDQTLRAAYHDAPTRPAEVVPSVAEGDHGTTLVYFLVQFLGERQDPQSWVSVDFATRDGSATAFEDYLPVSGRLVLYPDEDHAVIPVEVIGDTLPEGPENFFLDVFNPQGGSFGPGVVQLTAMRTILDDDAWV